MNIADTRQAVADALATVDGVTMRPRPVRQAPRPGDGWVVVQSVAPLSFRQHGARLAAVVVLGADDAAAEDRLNDWAVPLLDALTRTIPCAGTTLEPVAITTDGGAMYAAAIVFTVEVDNA